MKKLITLIAGLLLVALPVGLAGCDDSDKEIYNDGRLVTDVVIPTSMTVYRGMEVSVSGYGFAQGDAIALRAGEDLPAATTVASEKLLTFVIPDGAADQTVYKVVLNRAQDYQVLGSSKMTVQLAIDVDLGKTISGNWGGDAVIRGRVRDLPQAQDAAFPVSFFGGSLAHGRLRPAAVHHPCQFMDARAVETFKGAL